MWVRVLAVSVLVVLHAMAMLSAELKQERENEGDAADAELSDEALSSIAACVPFSLRKVSPLSCLPA
jgi:hypothetical protein